MRTKIFIVEDYPLFIDAIQVKLRAHSDDFQYVGCALNGKDALVQLETLKVDILILDIGIPEIDGLQVLKQVSKNHPNIKVLVLTMYDDFKHIREMLQAGAKGYMLKNKSGKYVIDALAKIRDGETYLQDEVAQVGAKSLMKNYKDHETDIQLIVKSLKNYEVKLLELLTLELTAKELADEMCVSSKTIETYKKNLAKKVGAKSSLGLVRFAIENGFKKDLN